MGLLDSLLNPASVAIIGASPDPHAIRGQLLLLLRKNGFAGRIVPVNPSHAEIGGLPCFPTIAAGGGADVALVAIAAAAVLPALEACAAAGVKHAVIISSGFAEDAAAPPDLQDRIAALAHRTGMRVLGPNAEGFHNEVTRVSATFSPAVDRDADNHPTATHARIGIVAQSGGMGFALYNRGRALGLSFSTIVSTGNEADLTAADLLAHMAADPDTACILLFLEAIRDVAAFADAARQAAAAGKPIVAIKAGRSAAGQIAAASHTASMAGWDVGYDAFFRHHGIVVAAELDEALTIAAALVTNPRAQGGGGGNRVAVVTISGGAGALSADMLDAQGLTLPELGEATQAEIRAFIPSYGTARNPIDLTAGGAQGGGTLRAIELLTRDPAIDQIICVTTLANPARVTLDGPALRALLAERRKPVLFYSYTLPSPLGRQTLADAGAVICPSLATLAGAARALQHPAPAPAMPPPLALPDAVLATLSGAAGTLPEHEAKALLTACGVEMAPAQLVTQRARLADAATAIGFPLAVKIQSAAIAHKTEAGGVRLGIADMPALEAAYDTVLANVARHMPDAPIDGVLLERMAAPGVEMIIGTIRDPTFGPIVSVGAGGVMTELFRDVAYALAPLDEAAAVALIGTLRSARLLHGWRGAPAADLPALARLVSLVSRIAAAGQATICELELNPVIVHPAGPGSSDGGCTVVDALLALSPAQTTGA